LLSSESQWYKTQVEDFIKSDFARRDSRLEVYSAESTMLPRSDFVQCYKGMAEYDLFGLNCTKRKRKTKDDAAGNLVNSFCRGSLHEDETKLKNNSN
jgi:hypothetical protein